MTQPDRREGGGSAVLSKIYTPDWVRIAASRAGPADVEPRHAPGIHAREPEYRSSSPAEPAERSTGISAGRSVARFTSMAQLSAFVQRCSSNMVFALHLGSANRAG